MARGISRLSSGSSRPEAQQPGEGVTPDEFARFQADQKRRMDEARWRNNGCMGAGCILFFGPAIVIAIVCIWIAITGGCSGGPPTP